MMLSRLFLMAGMAVCALTSVAVNPEYENCINECPKIERGNFDPAEIQSISGRFNGKDIDTLTVFPHSLDEEGEYYNKWIVVSRNATIPSVMIDAYTPILIAEGDLDGNGSDEFTVLNGGLNGCWMIYDVYTCYRSKIHKMISNTWYDCNEEPIETIVAPGKTKGIVNILYYDMSDVAKDKDPRHSKTMRITKYLK